ncbi:peroxide stress protein YaaA [Lactobacillus sp. R2/2]|nr:peroxide stress protein YaaA [Lactobacillus sp. R2/2]
MKELNLNQKDNLTPAVISYSGIQYQYMAADLFTAPALSYLQDNVRILSGLYGVYDLLTVFGPTA